MVGISNSHRPATTATGRKGIGLWQAVAIGIGGMIGAGIFSVLGIAGQIAGNVFYAAFGIAGGVALLNTYSYAKLGVRFPSAGGPVEFLVRGFGDGVVSGGFNILLWVGYVFGLSLYARAFGNYAATFLPVGSAHIWVSVFSTGIVVVFTLVNFVGAQAVGRSEFFIVATKVVILLAFTGLGLTSLRPRMLSPSLWPRPGNLLYGAAIVFLAYEGFGLIVNAAEDMPDPSRTLPRALYLSVIITIGIYVGVSLAVVGNLPVADIVRARDYALAEAARPLLGSLGFKLIAVAALFSTASAINATLYGGANVCYAVARDGELPVFFERKVWGHGTEGLLITSVLIIAFANLLNLNGIAMLGSASFLIIYGAVSAAHLRLRRETGAKAAMIWAAIVGCASSFGVLVYYELVHEPLTLTILAVVVVVCFGLEYGYRRFTRRSIRLRADGRTPSPDGR